MRDVRGFAIKFYTQEGNWDLVGNNIPVFFIQGLSPFFRILRSGLIPMNATDSMKFPDFVHAVKPEPHNEVPTGQTAHNNLWDYFNLQPESKSSFPYDFRTPTQWGRRVASHMIMWAMSDRAIPRSYRMMQGFGVNTYTLNNANGEQFFVKFHLIPELGVHSLTWDEAMKVCGQDPGE